MKKNLLFLLLILIISNFLFIGCKLQKPMEDPIKFEEISSMINKFGNEKSNIVIINTQGGPVYELFTNMMEKPIKDAVKSNDFLMVDVHQKQTKNPDLFQENEISFENAQEYDKESVATLNKVIKYYKQQEKNVYVLGMSYGAFMVQELISEYGVDVADKYAIVVGRLDMPDIIWKSFSEGNKGFFKDGIDPITVKETNIPQKNLHKLAAGLGKNRYTQKLAKYDLSKVTYIYALKDQAVGKLSEEEINFLKSKNAKVIPVDAGHQEASINNLKNIFKTVFELQ